MINSFINSLFKSEKDFVILKKTVNSKKNIPMKSKVNYLNVDGDYNEMNIISFKRSFSKLQTNYDNDNRKFKETNGTLSLKKGGGECL